MDFYVDHTPFINPVVELNIAPFQPRLRDQNTAEIKSLANQTAFVTEEAKTVDLFATTKGLLAQTKPPIPQLEPSLESTPTLKESVNFYTSVSVASQRGVEVDQIAKQRVRLMAAKYASGNAQSSEILARLEILNSRLSERAPLVSKEQVIALGACRTSRSSPDIC